MRFGGVEVARLFGIQLRLDWSWFAVLVLLTWTFATFDFPFRVSGLAESTYWILGFSAALLLFGSVLVHELAHALVARTRGIPVDRITLFIFGGVAEMRVEARRPLDEFLLTIVGPLASLLLAGLFWLGAGAATAADAQAIYLLAATLAQLNLILAVFNMVPAFPLDGGRVLRSILWQLTGSLVRATAWAAGVGRLFGWGLIGLGVWLFLGGRAIAGLWAAFLGWFLAGAAASAVRHNRVRALRDSLSGYPVSVALGDPVEPVDASTSTAAFVVLAIRSRAGAFLVERDGRVVGTVTVEAAGDVPAERRSEVPVFEIMTPLVEAPRLAATTPITYAADLLRPLGEQPAVVESGGEQVSVVQLGDIMRWIERLRALDG